MTQLHLSPSKKNTNLASLCLVDHLFLGIARPLLYHEIHLESSLHRNKTSSNYSKLVNTLLFAPTCASFVRSIKITLKADAGDMDCIVFRSLLRRCKGLERVSTGWEEWKAPEAIGAQVIEAISKEAKSIKYLEIPSISLRLPPTLHIVNVLKELKSIVFKPTSLSPELVPVFGLQQVAWMSGFNRSALRRYLTSSYHTLTTLSCYIEYKDPPMFDVFPNLSTLRLLIGDFRTDQPTTTLKAMVETSRVEAVRSVLLSTHSISVKHLTIATKSSETARTLADYSILEALPTTLVTLAVVPQLLGILNLPALLPLDQIKPYPSSLRRLTIIPPSFMNSLSTESHELMKTVSRQVSKLLQNREVDLSVELGANFGDRYGVEQMCGL